MIAYVIGSGPSGISVAIALLERGHNVVMLDYANKMSDKRKADVSQIVSLDMNEWNNELLKKIKYSINKDFPDKLIYAEDYPYRNSLSLLNISLQNCGLMPSLAQGGLSNVWGASILPYADVDIESWPIEIKDLAPHYLAISKFMKIAATKDDLLSEYPLYGDFIPQKTAIQTQQLHSEISKNKDYCNQAKMVFGYARSAYNSTECRSCSLCMWGCPFGLIYNSTQTLSDLIQNSNFKYISDVLVDKFVDQELSVKIFARHKNGDKLSYIADKLFLAGGVLATSKLVLSSLRYYEPIELKDSPYFIAPLINFKLKGDFVNKIGQNTLSQLFIEINDIQISKNTIHLQIYPYNEMLLELFRGKLGKLFWLLYPFIKFLLNKIVIVQGFFHSDEGEDLKVQLHQSGTMEVIGNDHDVDAKIKMVLRKMKRFGFVPTYEKSIPGRSFHCGGTFPMTSKEDKHDNKITVDETGLLKGTKNVHIVDASILPTIPSQTITYTVMANAYRIGSLFKC